MFSLKWPPVTSQRIKQGKTVIPPETIYLRQKDDTMQMY